MKYFWGFYAKFAQNPSSVLQIQSLFANNVDVIIRSVMSLIKVFKVTALFFCSPRGIFEHTVTMQVCWRTLPGRIWILACANGNANALQVVFAQWQCCLSVSVFAGSLGTSICDVQKPVAYSYSQKVLEVNFSSPKPILPPCCRPENVSD